MEADANTLTTLLNQFLATFQIGRDAVGVSAFSLLGILAALELTVAAMWWAITGDDALVALMRKILLVGFFVFIVENYDSLLNVVIGGFIHTGEIAGSAGGGNIASVRNPSMIVKAGLEASRPIFEHVRHASVLTDFADMAISGLCGLAILIAFFIIAIQVFITYLEFGIVTTLGLILIPFGVFRHTSFLAEKVFGAIISFGVKLMVLAFLVSVTVPVLESFTLPEDPTWTQLFNMVLVSFAIMALAWHAPGVAAGLLSGGPSLTAGTAAGSALAAGAGVAGAAIVGASAARTGAKAAGGAVSGAASGSVMGVPGGGVGSMVGSLVGAAIGSTKAVLSGAGDSLKTAYAAGRTGGYIGSGASKPTYPTKHHSGLARTVHQAKSAVPDTAQPSGGVSVPIKHDK